MHECVWFRHSNRLPRYVYRWKWGVWGTYAKLTDSTPLTLELPCQVCVRIGEKLPMSKISTYYRNQECAQTGYDVILLDKPAIFADPLRWDVLNIFDKKLFRIVRCPIQNSMLLNPYLEYLNSASSKDIHTNHIQTTTYVFIYKCCFFLPNFLKSYETKNYLYPSSKFTNSVVWLRIFFTIKLV